MAVLHLFPAVVLLAFPLLLFPTVAGAYRFPSRNIHNVYQFPNGTWVENIAVRSNGNLLVTLVDTPELWEINPFEQSRDAAATLIHHFDGMPSMTGITEIEPDVFAVGSPQTLWRVDFMSAQAPAVSEIATLPKALNLNGMATLDAARGLVLVADSMLGVVWRINVYTGEHAIVLEDARTMAPNTYLGPLVGIDGLRILGDYVYYNNCPRRLYCRVRIDPVTATAVGSYELISNNTMADDFALSPQGVGYLAGLIDNVITKVHSNGTHQVIAGAANSTDFAGATSAAFGRTELDRDVLYVTTGGASGIPVLSNFFEGGKIMALRL